MINTANSISASRTSSSVVYRIRVVLALFWPADDPTPDRRSPPERSVLRRSMDRLSPPDCCEAERFPGLAVDLGGDFGFFFPKILNPEGLVTPAKVTWADVDGTASWAVVRGISFPAVVEGKTFFIGCGDWAAAVGSGEVDLATVWKGGLGDGEAPKSRTCPRVCGDAPTSMTTPVADALRSLITNRGEADLPRGDPSPSLLDGCSLCIGAADSGEVVRATWRAAGLSASSECSTSVPLMTRLAGGVGGGFRGEVPPPAVPRGSVGGGGLGGWADFSAFLASWPSLSIGLKFLRSYKQEQYFRWSILAQTEKCWKLTPTTGTFVEV